MNYSDYKIKDWVTDDNFIAYVQGEESTEMDQLRNDPTLAEKMEKASQLVQSMGKLRPEIKSKKLDKIFDKVNATIDQPERPRAKIIRMKWVGIAAAAVAVFVIAMPFFLTTEKSHSTEVAQQSNFNLPDNSKIELNSVSSIKYNVKSWKKNRYLVLEGEAYFDVEEGSTFMVSSEQGIVTVIGTQFNIKDRAGIYEVKCTEGEVEVAVLGGNTYALKAGDRLVKKPSNSAVLEKKVVQEIDWLQNYVEVDNRKVSEVLDEVALHYDVKFEKLDTLGDLSYSGFFSTTSLDSAMQQIFWPLGAEFEIVDNKVIFK